jgi:NTP pyrophosphatase (non-canonical NTP hydrolase)
MDPSQQAIEFRQAFNVINSHHKSDFQFTLIEEEFREFTEAHLKLGTYEGSESDALKELADLVYVIFQYSENLEWDLLEALRRVHKSNMSKLDDEGKPIYRNDGKVLKGPNYKPPFLDDLFDKRFGFH